jgi:serine/threonine protein phosphatase PrpC
MQLQIGAKTDVGRVRTLNEDAYLAGADRCLFLVCDGMGGAPAGEVASDMAVRTIVRQFNDHTPDHGSAEGAGTGYLRQTSRLGDAIRRCNQILYAHAQEDPRHHGMGTTIVAAWLAKQIASIAHVGDSRAYLWHGGALEPLTRDHSLVEAQVRAGVLRSDSPAVSEQQNVLLRVLGRVPDVDVELSEVPLQRGDYLLLCSDGVTRMIPDPTIGETIVRHRDPQRIADQLIEAANARGGPDNATVIVVEIGARWWIRLSRRWSSGA